MKILHILPHCSTGGMPQYTYRLIQESIKNHIVEVIETDNFSDEYVVQREKIKKIVPLHQLYGNHFELFRYINNFDVIHFQEVPETFISSELLDQIYNENRTYKIIVTTHSSYTDPSSIKYTADKFLLVSNWSKKRFEKYFPTICDIWEYPIEKIIYDKDESKFKLGWDPSYKHILHVGLFTQGKNQKELIEIAKLCTSEKLMFHFVGNQAINFKEYWEPLLSNLPDNCIIHGEVNNPEDYYMASDLFYFPSLFELNPLAVKEALSYGLPVMLRNLYTYEDMYDDLVTYISNDLDENKNMILDILDTNKIKKFNKHKKSFVLYANENYFETVKSCIKSIKEFSDVPIILYMLNSDLKVELGNVTTVKWDCDLEKIDEYISTSNNNFYINRKDSKIYKLLIQRPLVVKHALENFSEVVCYIDSDSIATFNINDIFSYYDKNSNYPYFTEGIFDWMITDGRGGTNDMNDLSGTLEHNVCELFNINQYVRTKYVQTGYFVAGQSTIEFLEEWYWMCTHPKILKDFFKYAPFHEETIVNSLLWKYQYNDSLPYVYVNGGLEIIDEVYNIINFNGEKQLIRDWFRVPSKITDILFFHGIKDPITMDSMVEKIKSYRIYYNINKNEKIIVPPRHTIHINYVDGAFVEIRNGVPQNFLVEFIDSKTGNLEHWGTIQNNHWIKTIKSYFVDWLIKINGEEFKLTLKDARVLISMESSSLGDTLAWFPYIEEFRKKHNCHVICSTFHNYFFKGTYPELEFINPGTVVYNISASYKIGWFYDNTKEPIEPNTIPLQKTASNILGLEYKEIKPNIDFTPETNPYKQKYVVISPHSTAGLKYWNNPTGWQEVIDYLNESGYKVINISKEPAEYKKVQNLKDTSLKNVMNVIHHSEFMIGLSSGLSWLSWALGKHVVMISNFTKSDHEFQSNCSRIVDYSVCFGCWNKPEYRFDKGDWNWCPVNKGTERQFECHKKITSQMVINRIKNIDKLKKFEWGWMKDNLNQQEFLIKEIFEDKIYEKFFEVESGDVVLDIGCSVGPFPYSVSEKIKHVYCLEPSDVEFETLKKNMKDIPSTLLKMGISDKTGRVNKSNIYGGQFEMDSISFRDLIEKYNIEKIDFLKIDCEGGEYDVFNSENIEWIKKNIRKISGEWHLGSGLRENFRSFRDNILVQFNEYEIYSLDGYNIKWDSFNEHFLEYYTEVLIYIKNY